MPGNVPFPFAGRAGRRIKAEQIIDNRCARARQPTDDQRIPHFLRNNFRMALLVVGKMQSRSQKAKNSFARTSARSEEHTSELQSLMRISYAVFCLKKKTNKHRNPYNVPQQYSIIPTSTH